MSTTLDTDTDVNTSKPLLAKQQDRLLDLVAEHLGLQLVQRAAIDLDQTMSSLAVGHSSGSFLD
jgi:hypothetical protein